MKIENIFLIGIHGAYSEKIAQLLATRIKMHYMRDNKDIVVARLGLLDEVHKIVSTCTGFPLEKKASLFSYISEMLSEETVNDFSYMDKSIKDWIFFITESFRHSIRKDYWGNLLVNKITYLWYISKAPGVVITPDVQYENDMQFFKDNGVMVSVVDNIKNVQDLILYAESDSHTFIAGCNGDEQLSIISDDIFEQYIKNELNSVLWGK